MSVILSILYVCVPIYLSLLSCNCPLSLLFPSCWLSKEKWCKIFVIYWWWCLALATVPPCLGSHLDPFLIPPSSPALKLNIFIHLEEGGGCDFPRHLHLTIRFVSVVKQLHQNWAPASLAAFSRQELTPILKYSRNKMFCEYFICQFLDLFLYFRLKNCVFLDS